MVIENENTGLMFRNELEAGSKRPDMSGNINVNGEQFQIALWEKEGENGYFYSVKISPPYEEKPKKSSAPRKTYTKPARR